MFWRAFVVAGFLSTGLATVSADVSADDRAAFERPAASALPFFAFNPPTIAKQQLGARLFFDPQLSGSNTMACATCHEPSAAWSDPRVVSVNDRGEAMARRSQSLYGVGWSARFGWRASADALEGFVLLPITKAAEMNQDLDALVTELSEDPIYQRGFEAAFGVSGVTISGISQALATYLRGLDPPRTDFDHWIDGDDAALAPSARQGFEIFVGKAGCGGCHVGWRMTDDELHDIGLPGGAEDDSHAFKTPSLRQVGARAPYMHDGRLQTLGDVVDHYASGIVDRPGLSPLLPMIELTDQEKLNLVEFLNSL